MRKNHPALGVLFLKEHGVSVLGVKDSMRLMDLYDHSFIGEFEVIFRQPAERSYIAINRQSLFDVASEVYFCKPDDFHAILNDFEDFD